MFAVYLGSVWIEALEGLANHWVEGFQKHCYVVEGRDRVCYYVFESLDGVLGIAGFPHEVWVHAAGHGRVLEGGFGDHGLDGERDPGEVEISRDDLLPDNFDHFFAYGPYFIDLDLVGADFSSLVVSCLMAVFVVIGEKPGYFDAYLKAVINCYASSGVGVMNPS